MKKTLKCALSVNINKIATLRNARGGDVPNVLQCADDLIAFGAQGITVHPRPDERHIRQQDVMALKKLLLKRKVEFNIEGYPAQDFLKLLKKVRPEQATLVPDPPDVLTSNAGWRLAKNEKFLNKIIADLRDLRIRSSLFIDVFAWNKNELAALRRIRPDRVELFTERYANDYVTKNRKGTTARYAQVTKEITALGIAVNAGHDLSLKNVRYLIKNVPEIREVSIGHALIAEALYLGFQKVITAYRHELRLARKA